MDPINIEIEIAKNEDQDCDTDFEVHMVSRNKDYLMPNRLQTKDDVMLLRMEHMNFKGYDTSLATSKTRCRYHLKRENQYKVLFSNKYFEYGAFAQDSEFKY